MAEDGPRNIHTVIVIALRGKVSWQSGTKEYHKATTQDKPHLMGGENPRGSLPLLGRDTVRNRAEGRLYIGFLEVRSFLGWPGVGGIFVAPSWDKFRE